MALGASPQESIFQVDRVMATYFLVITIWSSLQQTLEIELAQLRHKLERSPLASKIQIQLFRLLISQQQVQFLELRYKLVPEQSSTATQFLEYSFGLMAME